MIQDYGQTLLFNNPQKSHESVHLLTYVYEDAEPDPTGFSSFEPRRIVRPVVQELKTPCQTWLHGVSLREFLLNSYEVNTHLAHAVDDHDFRFRLNSNSSLIAAATRRGAGNLLLVGPGVKLGPITQEYLDSQERVIQTVFCDLLPRHHVLMFYSSTNAMDQPFIVHDTGIVVNNRFEDYGRRFVVPPSQQA